MSCASSGRSPRSMATRSRFMRGQAAAGIRQPSGSPAGEQLARDARNPGNHALIGIMQHVFDVRDLERLAIPVGGGAGGDEVHLLARLVLAVAAAISLPMSRPEIASSAAWALLKPSNSPARMRIDGW